MDDDRELGRGVTRRKSASNLSFCVKKEKDGKYRKVYAALQKKEGDLTEEEQQLLLNNTDLVKKAKDSLKKREEVKARSEEVEDPDGLLLSKCQELADALRNSHHLVVYTGAGISTAAKIPDYRGSNGIWTLLQKGKDIGKHDLSQAEPTITHMALFELFSQGILKYVVSQNCDGLHLRSGLPRSVLSEVHGNMHLEVCQICRPSTQYWRMFDVTENTGRFSHRTMRRCHICHSALIDTIVHFGERGNLPWPLNWPAANKAADNADVILCIGSSLKVLKKYPWLWGMDKPVRKRPKLYIINLQWTPKDDQAVLKINGRCDRVMEEVMRCLNLKIPSYCRFRDPIFCHATHLYPDEIHTTSQPELDCPFKKEDDSVKEEIEPSKHCLKRAGASTDSDSQIKVRKVMHDPNLNSVLKEEILDPLGNLDSYAAVVASSINSDIDTKDISTIKGSGGPASSRGLTVLKEIETKQEQTEVDPHIFNIQTAWIGCESFAFFGSQQEVVGQINTCVDSKSLSDILTDTKDHDSAKALPADKREEDLLNSVLILGQGLSGNIASDTLLCSKVNLHNMAVDSCSIDGKENVAVHFSRGCNVETSKPAKKIESESSQDSNSESDKISKGQNSGPGVQLGNGEAITDSFCSLKGQKAPGRSHNLDYAEDEVGVLKMLQLEHNYSKSIDDSQIDSKEALNDVKLDLKEVKRDSVDPKEGRKNMRKISKERIMYCEEDDEDEDEISPSQSTRSSRRVQERQNAKQQSKEELKKGSAVKTNGSTSKVSKQIPPKNKKLTKADFEMRVELKGRTCNFCLNYYTSKTCLFYPSFDFRPWKFEGCVCECCDYSSESSDVEEEESNGETNEGKGDSTDNADEGTSKSSIVNPGWYGKGYRKRFRKRK